MSAKFPPSTSRSISDSEKIRLELLVDPSMIAPKQELGELFSRATRIRNWFFRPKILVLLVVLFVGVIAIFQVPNWLSNTNDREEYLLATTDIEITAPPRHVPVDLVEQVIHNEKLPKTVSLLDDALTEQIAAAFAKHPWVAEVVRVKKSFPAKLTVELKYRQPVAMVAVPTGVYPIDLQSVVLPPVDFSVADTRRYPKIRGVSSLPRGGKGERWGDLSVIGAAQLAHTLSEHWKEFQLVAIHISVQKRSQSTGKLDDFSYELETKGGSRIIWGRVPGSRYPSELTAAQKIGRLQTYLSDFGGFQHPHGPYRIDIRYGQDIFRRPLTVTQEPPVSRR